LRGRINIMINSNGPNAGKIIRLLLACIGAIFVFLVNLKDIIEMFMPAYSAYIDKIGFPIKLLLVSVILLFLLSFGSNKIIKPKIFINIILVLLLIVDTIIEYQLNNNIIINIFNIFLSFVIAINNLQVLNDFRLRILRFNKSL
jgi:hypothetical protein